MATDQRGLGFDRGQTDMAVKQCVTLQAPKDGFADQAAAEAAIEAQLAKSGRLPLVYLKGPVRPSPPLVEARLMRAAQAVALRHGAHLVQWPDRPPEKPGRIWSRAIIGVPKASKRAGR